MRGGLICRRHRAGSTVKRTNPGTRQSNEIPRWQPSPIVIRGATISHQTQSPSGIAVIL